MFLLVHFFIYYYEDLLPFCGSLIWRWTLRYKFMDLNSKKKLCLSRSVIYEFFFVAGWYSYMSLIYADLCVNCIDMRYDCMMLFYFLFLCYWLRINKFLFKASSFFFKKGKLDEILWFWILYGNLCVCSKLNWDL